MKIFGGDDIEIEDRPDLVKKYVKKTDIKEGKIKIFHIWMIFLFALKDFSDKEIDADNLAHVASKLYFELGKPPWFDNKDPELGNNLYWSSEVPYYKKEHPKQYQKIIEDLKKYYEENKELLEN